MCNTFWQQFYFFHFFFHLKFWSTFHRQSYAGCYGHDMEQLLPWWFNIALTSEIHKVEAVVHCLLFVKYSNIMIIMQCIMSNTLHDKIMSLTRNYHGNRHNLFTATSNHLYNKWLDRFAIKPDTSPNNYITFILLVLNETCNTLLPSANPFRLWIAIRASS